ncbi:DNA methyltransferase [Olegusella massiliensis]
MTYAPALNCIKYSVGIDPACGSGNFLTETYLSLRKLKNRVLADLYGET